MSLYERVVMEAKVPTQSFMEMIGTLRATMRSQRKWDEPTLKLIRRKANALKKQDKHNLSLKNMARAVSEKLKYIKNAGAKVGAMPGNLLQPKGVSAEDSVKFALDTIDGYWTNLAKGSDGQ
jgi:hypothetical protein